MGTTKGSELANSSLLQGSQGENFAGSLCPNFNSILIYFLSLAMQAAGLLTCREILKAQSIVKG